MITEISAPETPIARQAEELARRVSNDTLFNHCMRSYWFAELFAQQESVEIDSELMFLSAVLHDLGLTEHVVGTHRFEIEGATAARAFLLDQGVSEDRAQRVWDNIALHTWDINEFRGDTSRIMQRGLAYDVVGVPDAALDPADVAEVLRRYPRAKFKTAFYTILNEEIDRKQPYRHWFHFCTHVDHNRSPLTIADAAAALDMAPFDE
ncbi:HD domain-containing protein [Nocardia sp. NPDC004860]|uniref:HD domain-containing protein n=1 Tax=Nocardia sp. NPDC004860 TaxID=3154557 RepID=UPI0033B3BD78